MATTGSADAEFFLTGSPIGLQKAMLRLLGPIGRALGYQRT
jgi:hypothetical protein